MKSSCACWWLRKGMHGLFPDGVGAGLGGGGFPSISLKTFPPGPPSVKIDGICKNQSHIGCLYQLCHLMFNIWEGKCPEAFQNKDVFQVCGESHRQGWHLTRTGAHASQRCMAESRNPHADHGGTSVGMAWGLVCFSWPLDLKGCMKNGGGSAFSNPIFCCIHQPWVYITTFVKQIPDHWAACICHEMLGQTLKVTAERMESRLWSFIVSP